MKKQIKAKEFFTDEEVDKILYQVFPENVYLDEAIRNLQMFNDSIRKRFPDIPSKKPKQIKK